MVPLNIFFYLNLIYVILFKQWFTTSKSLVTLFHDIEYDTHTSTSPPTHTHIINLYTHIYMYVYKFQ